MKVVKTSETSQIPTSKSRKKQPKNFRNVVIGSLILVIGIIIIKSISSGNDVKGNPYDRIEINENLSNFVDNNLLVQKCEFSDELKIRIKKILSDNNPDPKNLNGRYCGTESHSCKYCGDLITQNTIYITKQDVIENLLKDPANNLGIGAISLIDENWDQSSNNNAFLDLLSSLYNVWTQDMKDEVIVEFEMLCNDFATGNKYECDTEGDYLEFCSLRCRNEYNFYN